MGKDTRLRILSGAERLFFKQGRGVKIDEIASYLGISKKTIYNHFKDKQDLIDNMVERGIEFLLSSLDKIASDRSVDFGERLMQLSEFSIQEFGKRGLSFIDDLKEYESRYREKLFPQIREKIERLISALMEEGLAKGFVREDIDREMVGPVYVGMLEGILRICGIDGRNIPVDRLLSANLGLLFRGILKPEYPNPVYGRSSL